MSHPVSQILQGRDSVNHNICPSKPNYWDNWIITAIELNPSLQKSYTVKYEHEVKKKCHVYHEESCHGWVEHTLQWWLTSLESSSPYCRYGYHKKCHVYPREECHDIPIKHPVKVPLGKFIDGVVTILICSVFNWKDPWPLFHFKEECHDVPKTHCKKFPIQVSLTSLFYLKSFNFVQVPHESCKSVPDKHCIEESTSINLFSISPNIPSKIHFFATINYCPMEPIENKWK